ncbi:MAG: glycoside hydrolase family 38 C-terminal domain-containing protein [Ilumatobacteraceae bacterium]
MHDDRVLAERRITRELAERIVPLVHAEVLPLAIEAGANPDDLAPFTAGDRWGPPWSTTWFRITGEIPDSWVPLRATRRVEAVIDLGFHPDGAGFQCEGLVVDDELQPVQGIHPRRTGFVLPAEPGPFELVVEAAANPAFVQFRPSPLGDPATLSNEHPGLYRMRRADLALVDTEAEALAHDLDVLDGVMRALPLDDPRRTRIRRTITDALDALATLADRTHRTGTHGTGPGSGAAIRQARRIAHRALGLPARASAHRIVAAGHAHIDTAWLWPMHETMHKCTRTFASAVRLMDDRPEYRFVCSQAQQYAWIEDQHPELFARITEKVAAGQWVPVGGSWVEPDMNLPSGESLVRQIVFGQHYFEDRFGVRCTEMWIPDVFGYPATLPQVFAAGGMRRFVTQKLSWNKQNRFPHHTFWWEGLDGTRVLTHFPPVDTYNAEITPTECAHASANFAEHAWSDWSLMPFGHGDGGGGPTREMLERATRLADVDGAPRVEVGTPAQFFDHVEREVLHGADPPVWRGELYFETHRGTLTSQWRTKAGNRQCERLLREVELWAATLGLPAGVDHLWREVLTLQFHDILPGSSIAWVHDDAEATHRRVAEELERRIAALVDDLVPVAPTLTNPASLPRDEVVIVPTGPGAPSGHGPRQAIDDHTQAFRCVVPGCSVAAAEAFPIDDRVVVTERSMMNRHLAVRWDDAGNLTSVIDLAHARELLPEGELGAVLELAADHPVEYDAWDVEAWTVDAGHSITAADRIAVLADGPLVGMVRVERSVGPSSFGVTYTLRAGSPRLDIDIGVDWQHREHLLSMVFPLDVRTDTASCDVQFGVVRRPTHASTSWDAAKFEVCAHRFVDLSEPGFGVTVLNDGPGYGHGLLAGGVRVSLVRAAGYPDPDADRGDYATRLAIFPHGSGLDEVTAEAERFTRPVRLVTGAAATAPAPIVSVVGHDGDAAPGVELDAVKPADDGSGDLVVRLHEHTGDRRRITVGCPGRPIVAASTCNLLEEPQRGLEVGDGIAVLTLHPFQLTTLRLGF